MIKSIGIRCTPGEVFFTISESSDNNVKLLAVDSVIVPIALETPEKLKFIRSTFLDILEEYGVNNACIRITESNSQSKNIDRINLEAIIQELIASSTIVKYFIGQISNITSKLCIPRDDFKRLIAGEINYESVQNWADFNNYQKESILSSISAIKL
jgi:hypothetical protein